MNAVSWSPDGQYIVSASSDRTVQVWDTTGDHIFTHYGHAGEVFAASWSPNGTYIASASSDKTVQVWNVATDTNISIQSDHSNNVYCLAWLKNGTYIASAGLDKAVRVWNVITRNNASENDVWQDIDYGEEQIMTYLRSMEGDTDEGEQTNEEENTDEIDEDDRMESYDETDIDDVMSDDYDEYYNQYYVVDWGDEADKYN